MKRKFGSGGTKSGAGLKSKKGRRSVIHIKRDLDNTSIGGRLQRRHYKLMPLEKRRRKEFSKRKGGSKVQPQHDTSGLGRDPTDSNGTKTVLVARG